MQFFGKRCVQFRCQVRLKRSIQSLDMWPCRHYPTERSTNEHCFFNLISPMPTSLVSCTALCKFPPVAWEVNTWHKVRALLLNRIVRRESSWPIIGFFGSFLLCAACVPKLPATRHEREPAAFKPQRPACAHPPCTGAHLHQNASTRATWPAVPSRDQRASRACRQRAVSPRGIKKK